MSAVTQDTVFTTSARHERMATIAKLTLIAQIILQLYLRLVDPNYWGEGHGLPLVLTLGLGLAFWVTYIVARRGGALASRLLSPLFVIAVHLILIWI